MNKMIDEKIMDFSAFRLCGWLYALMDVEAMIVSQNLCVKNMEFFYEERVWIDFFETAFVSKHSEVLLLHLQSFIAP